MITVYEIVDGGIRSVEVNSNKSFALTNTAHLLIEDISSDYYCITNSFQDRSFLIKKSEWSGRNVFPIDFEKYVCVPKPPLEETKLSKRELDAITRCVSFCIVLSYECNLRCKYCYQQCNTALEKKKISDNNLSYIFSEISRYHDEHPEKQIDIELFGGEPLLKENYDDVIKILDFCVEHRFPITITTNGVELPYYLKDLVIYSGLNITIGTTIDSISKNELTRFSALSKESKSGNILKSVMTLINNKVTTFVQMNIDQHNIDEIESMIQFYQDNGFLENPLFHLEIGIVDDRRFETGYDRMVTCTELVERLFSIKITAPNVHFAFVKSTLNLCKKIDPGFRETEKKYLSNYCWAAAPIDEVYYIDPDLDVYRCTYSVGRKECAIFNLAESSFEKYTLPNRTYVDYPRCMKCVIGGYCAGGCSLSAEVDFQRMCSNEKQDFMLFLQRVYYPRVKALINTIPSLYEIHNAEQDKGQCV